MTNDFMRVRATVDRSALAAAARSVGVTLAEAWRHSRTGAVVQGAERAWMATAAAQRIRGIAGGIAIAAIVAGLLARVMPLTIAPAMPPAAFALVAAFAGLSAWQADAMARAWSTSRVAARLPE